MTAKRAIASEPVSPMWPLVVRFGYSRVRRSTGPSPPRAAQVAFRLEPTLRPPPPPHDACTSRRVGPSAAPALPPAERRRRRARVRRPLGRQGPPRARPLARRRNGRPDRGRSVLLGRQEGPLALNRERARPRARVRRSELERYAPLLSFAWIPSPPAVCCGPKD